MKRDVIKSKGIHPKEKTMYKQNLHIHSTYDDGKDTPEQMLEAARAQGFDSIGFSLHSYMHFAPERSATVEGTEKYKEHIFRLKREAADEMPVFCGIELEVLSQGIDLTPYDYVIASSHYFKIGDEFVGFDRSAEEVGRVIDTYFGGDGMAYAKRFYEGVAQIPSYGKFDILGHVDIVTKHIEKTNYFDADSKEYRRMAIEAVEALAGKIPFFEVNTGAIARGYRTTPYPAPFLIKEMRRLGFGAMISSDCHDRRFLDCGYEDAAALLRECGFREIYVLTEKGFAPSAL